MKHIKLFENFKDKLENHFIEGKYLYHYTLVDNIEDIKKEGLIPNKNSNYKNGANAVFLTNKSSLSKANLPSNLMIRYEEFYNSFYDEDDDVFQNSEDDYAISNLFIKVDLPTFVLPTIKTLLLVLCFLIKLFNLSIL